MAKPILDRPSASRYNEECMGWFRRPENAPIAAALRCAFAEWIDNGHNNFDDPNCVILKISLTKGTLFSHGTRCDIDFTAEAST